MLQIIPGLKFTINTWISTKNTSFLKHKTSGCIHLRTIIIEQYCRSSIYHLYTITALERDQYEDLWSGVQQYWTRRSRVQYCCTLLHETSYWSSSSVVIVLLHMALFYSNFEILWKLWNFWKYLKILSFWIFF